MSFSEIVQAGGVILIFLGAVVILITALGLIRLPDLLSRMHAATKPQVFGLLLLCVGASMVMLQLRVAAILFLVWLVQLIAAPISAHMLGNAAFKADYIDRKHLAVDEYSEDIIRANRQRLEDQKP